MSTHTTSSSRILALATSAVLLVSSAAHAQVVGGTIAGVVTDPTGAIVQHASVIVRNEETGTHRTLLTGDDGRFAAISIPAGRYTLTAEAPGFAQLQAHQSSAHRRPIHQPSRRTSDLRQRHHRRQLAATRRQSLHRRDLRPRRRAPGERSSAQRPQLRPTAHAQPRHRQLHRRSAPAAVGTSNSSVGNMFSISGRRPQDNLFLLNGIEYTGASLINVTPGGTSGQLLGVDGVREFNVCHRHLLRRLRQARRCADLHRHRLRHQPHPRHRIRVPSQQLLRRAQLLRPGRIPEFQRNNFGALARRPDSHEQALPLRQLRRLPPEPGPLQRRHARPRRHLSALRPVASVKPRLNLLRPSLHGSRALARSERA